jgi:hypothetical protein
MPDVEWRAIQYGEELPVITGFETRNGNAYIAINHEFDISVTMSC